MPVAKCKQLFLMVNRNTGESETVFLEGWYNYFDMRDDWFIVKIISDGKRAYRQVKKIPREVGERLWEMVK